jgi:hypothetical protein
VQNALGVLGTPGIASIRFGSEPVPDGLTGQGGCTIAAPGEVENRAVALRIGSDGRVSDIYLGPPADEPGNRDAYRNLIELDYTLPASTEFVVPADFVEDDAEPEVSFGPRETPVPLVPADGAWEATAFPLPGELVGAYVGSIVDADGRWIAVGSGQTDDGTLQSLTWTSADGVQWELGDAPPGFTGMSFSDMAWDGTTFLAVGYRTQEQPDDGTYVPDRPESWLSTDGVTWTPGTPFDAGANPGQPVRAPFGWVAGGSVWTGETQRSAFFTSPDGVAWTTHQPGDAAYGSVGRPQVDADGTIRATSCETPEPTNVAAGSPCFVREWTSTDGTTWTPGPASDDTGGEMVAVPAGDRLLAIRSHPETSEPELVRSDDGSIWEAIPLPAESIWPGQLVEVPGAVLLIAQRNDTVTATIMRVWRTADGGDTWDEIPLGVLPGAFGVVAERAIATDDGFRLTGWIELEDGQARPVVWVEP